MNFELIRAALTDTSEFERLEGDQKEIGAARRAAIESQLNDLKNTSRISAPSCRRKQMQALLASVKEDNNPVVMAGDLNTTVRNNTPTSIRSEIMSRVTDYKFWAGQAVFHLNPLGKM